MSRGRSPLALVDSCGWLEVLAATPLGEVYRPAFDRLDELVVPVVCILEVAQHLLKVAGDAAAAEAVAMMSRARVVPLSLPFALEAACLGDACRLPFPDNVVMATGLRCGATVWTHDEHFRGLRGNIRFVDAAGGVAGDGDAGETADDSSLSVTPDKVLPRARVVDVGRPALLPRLVRSDAQR